MRDFIPPAPDPRATAPAFTRSGPQDTGGTRVDRRRRRRALISVPIRIRPTDASIGLPEQISTTVNVSRLGVLFVTALPAYSRGMAVQLVFPYSNAPGALVTEQTGYVIRVSEVAQGWYAVAIALGSPAPENAPSCPSATDSGQTQPQETPPAAICDHRSEPKPLVLALDSEPAVLEMIRTLLSDEGYEVIGVNNSADAHDVLKLFTPVIVIAEIEGEGFPGYDLCAHIKATPRLQCVPVVLTTQLANPTDYSNAHSLGAVVCMAKPFRNERLVHITHLLAPLKRRYDSGSAA